MQYEITRNRVCYRIKGKGNKVLLIPIEAGEFVNKYKSHPSVMKLVYVSADNIPNNYTLIKIGSALFKVKSVYQGDDEQWLNHGKQYPNSEWAQVIKGMIKE